MVKRHSREANIKEVSSTNSGTFVGVLVDAMGDISTAQKLAGHSDPVSTACYDRRGERAMREVASHLHVPTSVISLRRKGSRAPFGGPDEARRGQSRTSEIA
jgi:hypothetical protein